MIIWHFSHGSAELDSAQLSIFEKRLKESIFEEHDPLNLLVENLHDSGGVPPEHCRAVADRLRQVCSTWYSLIGVEARLIINGLELAARDGEVFQMR